MKSILSKHAELQEAYSRLPHYDTLDPSNTQGLSAGDIYDYIKQMQFFVNEEINELLLELAQGDRAIHKPWSTKHSALRSMPYRPTSGTRGEAMDSLCFMMNIMLAAGVTPENLTAKYDEIHQKNKSRQADATY
jgi:hypothetical protein